MEFKGIYPACVTPFGSDGAPDEVGLAKLLALFQAAGCAGAVVGGTHGEGPSLSAVEKRDLLRSAVKSAPDLQITLGIATSSLTEAQWLASQAGKSGAAGILLIAPGYFRDVSQKAVVQWFLAVADASTVPVIANNFPKFTGLSFDVDMVKALARHPNIAGIKDSSGNRENLAMFRFMAPDCSLLIGDETLLIEALQAGWQGSISGAANLVPAWVAQIAAEFADRPESAQIKFDILLPVIEEIRSHPQPATNKAVLAEWGVIGRADVRLPLETVDPRETLAILKTRLGLTSENIGIPKRKYGD